MAFVALNAVGETTVEVVSVAAVFGRMHREHELTLPSLFDPYASVGGHPVVRVHDVEGTHKCLNLVA